MIDFHQSPLSVVEGRVLGVLMEKARTVPDSYPLSLNSLTLGCNQKSSRDPVLQLSETQVADAVQSLAQNNLVLTAPSGRVPRFEHNVQRILMVPEQSAVLLGMLLLRGPQTAGELRLNTERWYRFLDIDSVEGFLNELQDRSDEKGGPLVVQLPRPAGGREPRWAQLLCGPVDMTALATDSARLGSGGADLTARVAALEAQNAIMMQRLNQLGAELGLTWVDDHAAMTQTQGDETV